MKTSEKIASAVTPFIGKVLTSKMIVALTLENYPDTNPGSIMPSDCAGPNPRSGAIYSDQLFSRVGSDYLVLAIDKRVSKPSTRGERGVSLADALASAKALLAVKPAVTPAVAVNPAVSAQQVAQGKAQGNGQAKQA